jgi:predicted metalloendopeptidase
MAQLPWDQKLTDFLKTAGEELRRTGEELKSETQRMIDEVTDPEMQTRMRQRIHQLGLMAKETAAEAAAKLQAAFGGKPKPKRKARKARSSATPRKAKKGTAKRSARRTRRR